MSKDITAKKEKINKPAQKVTKATISKQYGNC